MRTNLEEMLENLAEERARVYAEIQKIDSAIDSLEQLVEAQKDRGIGITRNGSGMSTRAVS